MDRLQWRRASQDFEARDREAVKLGQDLAPMDQGNGEERARSKGLMEFGACVASTFGKMKWNAQGNGMTCRAFYFTGQRLYREVHDII